MVYKLLLGVDRSPEWQSSQSIKKQALQNDIPPESNFILDTVAYHNGLREVYSALAKELIIRADDSSAYFHLKRVMKDDLQPTQFRLFDKNGVEIFKLVNCYVDPPIPMNWNVNGCFDVFPPVIDIASLNTHHFDLNFLLHTVEQVDHKKPVSSDLPEADFYGVIVWNEFFKRPSGKLIKTVRAYVEESGQSVHLIYVNNHNAYLWQVMNAEDKKRVKRALR